MVRHNTRLPYVLVQILSEINSFWCSAMHSRFGDNMGTSTGVVLKAGLLNRSGLV